MRKQWMVFVAAMTALGITACGSGDGIVINGTSAAEADSGDIESGGAQEAETTSGTKIEIVTGETTAAPETAAQSTEEYTQASESQTQAETAVQTAAQTTAAVQAVAQETTAAKVYKVTDMKKTMYATGSVRVRSSYSTSSDVLAGLAKDEKIEVTGQAENGWFRVNYKGHTGYVSKDYLTEKEPQTSGTQANSSNTSNSGTSRPSGTASGTTTTKPAGPTAGNSGTASGQTNGPGSGGTGSSNSSNNGVGPGGAASPGGTTFPSGTGSPGGSASPSGSSGSGGSSVTGSVTALDPSGVTIQTSTGSSYQFVWGDSVPALSPGDKIQIFYETTSSGERKVTSYSK